jgi:hypothetical protein
VRGQDVGERWAAALVLARGIAVEYSSAFVAAGNLLDEVDDAAPQF